MSSTFWAGYLSGAAGIVIGNPLDVLKVRLQAPLSGPSSSTNRAWAVFKDFGTLVKGLPAPILTYGALNAVLFWSYSRSLENLPGAACRVDPNGPNTDETLYAPWAHFTAGAIAGFATFGISAPTELIKCRAQVAGSSTTESSRGSWSITKDIWRQHGIRGFFRGGMITSFRDAIGYGFYFWSYEASKAVWSQKVTGSGYDSHWDEQMKILLCGGVAGVATWVSIFPLDVIKTRVQTQPILMGSLSAGNIVGERQPLASRSVEQLRSPSTRSLSTWELTRITYQTEGGKAFFRGLTVCSIRAFIVNAVQWMTYEWARKLL